MEDRVKKFKSIFYGLDRAYGQYVSDGQSVNGKASGKAFILKQPVTDQLWIDHINGKDPSLGIIPIRDDSSCIWGCIDIDTYPLDFKKIVSKIRKLDLPLVMCRSKSGGAHIFLFLREPTQAKIIRDKLIEWSGLIGYANCEVFPKQIEIRADRGDTGNFLNLPYHGGDESMRHAFDDDGQAITLDEFFLLYEKHSVGLQYLKDFKPKVEKQINDLANQPESNADFFSDLATNPKRRVETIYNDQWRKENPELSEEYISKLGEVGNANQALRELSKEYESKPTENFTVIPPNNHPQSRCQNR